jgi:hypothetical protein
LYATVGAGSWVVRSLGEVPDRLGAAWRERDRWWSQAGDAYQALAERGETIVDQANEELQDQARKVGHVARLVPGVSAAEGEVAGVVSEEGALPLTNYDSRTAAEIIQKLSSLSQRELHQIEGYETVHRARTTILARIDELRGQEPWSGYDEMTVEEILPRVRELSSDERSAVAVYENQHKHRRTVIDAVTD